MPKRSTAALQTPRAVALIAQETVLSLWNRLTMGWLALSLGCCLALSHLGSESPAAVNPLEITSASSPCYAGTFASVLTLQKKEETLRKASSWPEPSWAHCWVAGHRLAEPAPPGAGLSAGPGLLPSLIR